MCCWCDRDIVSLSSKFHNHWFNIPLLIGKRQRHNRPCRVRLGRQTNWHWIGNFQSSKQYLPARKLYSIPIALVRVISAMEFYDLQITRFMFTWCVFCFTFRLFFCFACLFDVIIHLLSRCSFLPKFLSIKASSNKSKDFTSFLPSFVPRFLDSIVPLFPPAFLSSFVLRASPRFVHSSINFSAASFPIHSFILFFCSLKFPIVKRLCMQFLLADWWVEFYQISCTVRGHSTQFR